MDGAWECGVGSGAPFVVLVVVVIVVIVVIIIAAAAAAAGDVRAALNPEGVQPQQKLGRMVARR